MPLLEEVAVRVRPIALFTAVTTTLGIAAPEASVTSPLMSPVVRCADTDVAQRRRKIRVQLIDREIRLDIRPPRRKVKSVAGTTRLGEILCRCRFLSTRFGEWVELKFFSLLTQIYINVARRSGRQTERQFSFRRTRSPYTNQTCGRLHQPRPRPTDKRRSFQR